MTVCGFRRACLYLSFGGRPPPPLLPGSCGGALGDGSFVLLRVFFGGVGVGVVWVGVCGLLCSPPSKNECPSPC